MTPMCLGDCFHETETKAQPAGPTAALSSVETFPTPIENLRRHADARISNGDRNLRPLPVDPEINPTSRRRVFDCIVQEVGDHLPESASVCHERNIFRDRPRDCDVLLFP